MAVRNAVAVAYRNGMGLRETAREIDEATAYMLDEYPPERWRLIRTNNMIERLNREIRRRTRKIGAFPDGTSALMLITARVRDVTRDWGDRRYLDMSLLQPTIEETNENPHTGSQG
ncbi:putative IS256 family transposase [Bifidobacterium bohemicum DSM 22767]|uniref:Mutator family transposase n=3 Tax=Bifidobacterium bohemicum TaxID=638617 RepID=A0A086ZGM5_9BIFI|nr:putative IS256 family transposase [Bifidobacterium bohemicum DSM 22767]